MLGRLSRGLTAAAALGVVLLVPSALRAQDLGPILLSYRASAGCPEVAEFQRSVQRRSSRIRFVDEGTHDRELSIALSVERNFTKGELRLLERDGRLRQRSVRFTTCAEAVEGLALITAVSLDPQALFEPAAPADPAKAAPASAKSPPPVSTRKAPIPNTASPAPVREPRIEVGIGGEINAAFRALPASALGGTLFLDVASGSRAWLTPLVRLSVSHAQRRGLSDAAGSNFKANFALTLATLSGCPARIGVGILVFRPCLFASAGALRAWGSNSPIAQGRTRQYWVWGGSGLVLVRAAQSIEIVGDILLGANLIRDQFGFERAQSWKTPALYLSSGVGLRFVFP
jgi:hypothetical protein